MKQLSIIVPVYNGEIHIRGLLEELMQQMTEETELLMIDDGSTDQTCAICREYEEKDSNITVYSQKNQGPGAARNCGIRHAAGEYLVFLDADDAITDDYVKTVLELIEKKEAWYELQWQIGSKEQGYKRMSGGFSEGRLAIEDYFPYFARQKTNIVWNKIYKHSILMEHDILFPEDIRRGEDLLFNLCYLLKVDGIYMSEKDIYRYTLNPEGICGAVRLDYFEDERKVYDCFQAIPKAEKYSEEIESALIRNVVRTIGECMQAGMERRKITEAMEAAGFFQLIASKSYVAAQDRFRKWLIQKKAYGLIRILVKKR